MGRPDHVEMALVRAFGHAVGQRTPPRLAAAMRHAVFPGGARVRPRLLMAVAHACGVDDDGRAAAEDAAAAVELMHCASLVHDDLPCFELPVGPDLEKIPVALTNLIDELEGAA